jgi:DNA-binding Xre family transcriptional regulator
LGISQKLASKIETNKGISNETLDKVAAKLRLHPEDLLDDGICPYCGHERKE